MKIVLLLICMLTIGAWSATAQENNGRNSTKYILFPDFDKDVRKVNASEDKNARKAVLQTGKSTREQIFTNYNKQQTATRSAKPAAQTAGKAKLLSDTKAEIKPQAEVKKREIPLQQGQEPKEMPTGRPKPITPSKQQ
jgi:hypothetical protein